MRFHKWLSLSVVGILVFAGVSASLGAWIGPILIGAEANLNFQDKVPVRFHPSGAVYITCMAHNADLERKDVYLFRYAGVGLKGEKIGKVSDGKRFCYEPDMYITEDGVVHITWAEATHANAEIQSIMYRSYDNGTFSPVQVIKDMNIPGTLDPSSFNKEKIDNLKIAVDNDGNVFTAFMVWPSARCKFLSRYGTKVTEEEWPVGGRSKHPSLCVDQNYVHIGWQQLLGAYTVYYARRENTPGAKWTAIDVKGGIHRPAIDLDQNGDPHYFYMANDGADPGSRHVVYKYWLGNRFSARESVSGGPKKYQNVEVAVKDNKNMIVTCAVFKSVATDFLFNWRKNGLWNPAGVVQVPGASGKLDNPMVDLSNSDIGAFSYNMGGAVYLILSDPLVLNDLPVAVINADKDTVFWDEEVAFNANGSSDKDGSIVRYEWKVIQDNVTLDGASITYRFNKSYNNVRVRLTVIDDKNGRGSAEKVINVKALYTAPATWSIQPVQTLVFNRQGNVVTWEPNPKNDAAGYTIVKYKIFRREGDGEYQEIAEVNADKRAFADVAIDADKTYYYAVSAVDDQGHKSPYDNF
ncbi:MAG: hypothetical protein JXO51_07965 [Candidatus Aminicenantes bacterium]|nr:hypothetical protein [Candidatus Aminicenantes bacterium]